VAVWDELIALAARHKDQPYWGELSFPPALESQFQTEVKETPWFTQFKERYGEEPNLDSKDYNTRRAWINNIRPQDTPYDPGLQHWTSALPGGGQLKNKDHPSTWKNDYMQMTGKDPDAVNLEIFKRLLQGR
jgi:hypothetical protein